MPISLNNGQVHIIDNKASIDRKWALSFLGSGHREDYLLLYNEYDQYSGIVTYKSLLDSIDLETAVIHEKLYIDDGLWQQARDLLYDEKTIDAVPVFDQNAKVLCFAKYNKGIENAWGKLCELEENVDWEIWKTFQCHAGQVHIKGINDVLFRLREWLLSLGTRVSVEGKEWSFWGIESTICMEDDIVVIDEGCQWINLVYVEYLKWIKSYGKKLKEMLCKPYIPEPDKKEKVIFYLSSYPYYVESIEPLILRYLCKSTECICTFPSVDGIVKLGPRNIDNMTAMIEKLEMSGVKCYDASEKGLLNNEYDICFFLCDDLGRVPLPLRRVSKCVVALQETPIYPHMYMTEGVFEEVFSERGRSETDYLVVSDYMADWICERNKQWEEKILRFGYPKLDTLYSALNDKSNIPKHWLERISGKKVYLFTTYTMKQSWLDFFADKEDNKIAIWRLHPIALGKVQVKKHVEDICNKYNVIVDDLPSYYASFQISSALIAPVHGSLMLNYLYTGKPMCLYEKGAYESSVIDYRIESWYKSAYSALNENDVLQFIKKVEEGMPLMSGDKEECRKHVTSNFDGKVCDRIYNYLKNIRNPR